MRQCDYCLTTPKQYQIGNALLEPIFPVAKGIRPLGLSLSTLGERDPGGPSL
jgi:hypothetical protein